VVILAGDHIYRMDYARMLEEHVRRQWEVTIACVPVPLAGARAFGVVEIDHDQLVKKFVEKSANPPPMPDDPAHALASMGIYVFNLSFLLDILAQEDRAAAARDDFGRDILPGIVQNHAIGAYRFGGVEGRVSPDGYWRDVGTLDAYYEANMDLLKPVPPMNLYQKDWAIRTYHGQYPPARNTPSATGERGSVTNTLLAGGDVIVGAQVAHSILSPDVWVDSDAVVEDAILFEGVRVGAGARLRRCIVDKTVTIPPKETIGWDPEQDRRRFALSDGGVVVVPKGYRFD
jgi:glucose-1-phosphate adenylyltransferase